MKSLAHPRIAAVAARLLSMTTSLASALATVAVIAFANASIANAAVLDIKTVSTRADRVSGGDVLVQITQDNNAATPVFLNGADVTSVFRAVTAANTRIGLVGGLIVGVNTLSAGGLSLQIHNYPITGPITSGPHNTPFFCQTQDFTLPDGTKFGTPTDVDCSAPTKITYMYLPTGGTALLPLPSTSSLPANVAQTTTTIGATVNFVVRVETTTIDRGIYQTAVLHDPTIDQAPTWFAPPRGWNKRLIAIEGFGCPGGWYLQGASIGNLSIAGLDFNLLSPARLGAGYALFSNTLQHASNNCNAVLAGEAAMMSKEHFVKTFGVPVYTVSYGCSGGSYGSAQPADALPGLFDGILISCTFPDPLGIAFSGSDGHLLTHYFNVTDPAGFSVTQQVAVSGYKGLQAFIDAANQSGRTDPVPGRVDIPGYASASWNAASIGDAQSCWNGWAGKDFTAHGMAGVPLAPMISAAIAWVKTCAISRVRSCGSAEFHDHLPCGVCGSRHRERARGILRDSQAGVPQAPVVSAAIAWVKTCAMATSRLCVGAIITSISPKFAECRHRGNGSGLSGAQHGSWNGASSPGAHDIG